MKRLCGPSPRNWVRWAGSQQGENMLFHEWLETQRDQEGPVGDMARAALVDKDRPNDKARLNDWLVYCESKGASDAVLDKLTRAWRECDD